MGVGGVGGVGGSGGVDLGGAGGTAGAGGDDCGGYSLHAEPTTEPGNVVVLFDQSWTMGDPWTDPATGVSGPKHFVAGDALIKAITPIQSDLNAGAIFFPTTPAPHVLDLCPAGVAPMTSAAQIPLSGAPTFIAQWGAHFAPPWTTVLGTPLNKALHQADAALQTPPAGNTVVVIFTDGHWTCMDNTEVATVASLHSRGIETYVVGLPGAYGITQLDELAAAGEPPRRAARPTASSFPRIRRSFSKSWRPSWRRPSASTAARSPSILRRRTSTTST